MLCAVVAPMLSQLAASQVAGEKKDELEERFQVAPLVSSTRKTGHLNVDHIVALGKVAIRKRREPQKSGGPPLKRHKTT